LFVFSLPLLLSPEQLAATKKERVEKIMGASLEPASTSLRDSLFSLPGPRGRTGSTLPRKGKFSRQWSFLPATTRSSYFEAGLASKENKTKKKSEKAKEEEKIDEKIEEEVEQPKELVDCYGGADGDNMYGAADDDDNDAENEGAKSDGAGDVYGAADDDDDDENDDGKNDNKSKSGEEEDGDDSSKSENPLLQDGFQFNSAFQTLLDELKAPSGREEHALDRLDLMEELTQLSKDFVSCCTRYAKIIISERFAKHKTIPPVNVGGVIGGEKYCVQGLAAVTSFVGSCSLSQQGFSSNLPLMLVETVCWGRIS
jgi:hypothetical protein